MLSNYPPGVTDADIDAHFGPGISEQISDDTMTAAAMVWLASACGMDWTEASAWLDDCLNADEPACCDESWREAAEDELRGMFADRPASCLKQIGDHEADLRKTALARKAAKAALAVAA